jgi:hypothetical protein
VPTRKTLDQRPGSVPDIRAHGDSVTFRFAVPSVSIGAGLVIRCSADGAVWASIDCGQEMPIQDGRNGSA